VKTRKVLAALGVAGAITGGLALAAPANADNNTVNQWADESWSISAQGQVRPADMIDHKIESIMAEPQTRNELGAINRSWSKSFCGPADTSWKGGLPSGSERCRDRGR